MNTITLDTIIRNACAAGGDVSANHYGTVARFARMAISQLGLYLPQSTKAELFTVPENYLLPLPASVVQVLRVGVIDSDGRVVLLWQNDRLRKWLDVNGKLTPEDCDCDTTTTQSIDAVNASPEIINNFFFTPVDYGELYGYMPDRYPWGSWRHDVATGTLELASGLIMAAGDTIVVEYVQAAGAELMHNIPIEAENVLFHKTISLWLSITKPSIAGFHFQQFRREWGQMKRFMNRRSPEEWAASFQQYAKGGPKG